MSCVPAPEIVRLHDSDTARHSLMNEIAYYLESNTPYLHFLYLHHSYERFPRRATPAAAFSSPVQVIYTAHFTLDIAKRSPIALAPSNRHLPQVKTPGTGMHSVLQTSPHRLHPKGAERFAVVVPVPVLTHDYDAEQRTHLACMVLVRWVEDRIHDPDTPVLSLTLHLEDDPIVHRATVSMLEGSLKDGLHLDLHTSDPQIGIAFPVSIKPWSLHVVLFIREHPGARKLPDTPPKQLRVHRSPAAASLTSVPVSPPPHVTQRLAHARYRRRVDFHRGWVCVCVCVCDNGHGAPRAKKVHPVRVHCSRGKSYR